MSTLAEDRFQRIATFAKRRWGLDLTERKRPLVANRLASFLRKSKRFDTVDAYLDHLERGATEDDMLVFFDLLSTNVTSFFRDPQHFNVLDRQVYQALRHGTSTRPQRRLKLWSAACSMGCEPYSMAMHALEQLPASEGFDVKILATDLAGSVLRKAEDGVYSADVCDKLTPERRKRFMEPVAGGTDLRVRREVRSMVSFKSHNLMEPPPSGGPFDAIFCRNVMIYFDRPTREKLVNRLASVLRPGGILAVGSAETLSGIDAPLKPLAASVYVR
jgi:chemotaxis protein methyltransferase CheR